MLEIVGATEKEVERTRLIYGWMILVVLVTVYCIVETEGEKREKERKKERKREKERDLICISEFPSFNFLPINVSPSS